MLFSGFPHTTSSSCSGFAQDIYLDTGVGLFRFSAHYIIQMLQLSLGPLHGHGGCFFWVFRTLHHPLAPVFLGTLTWTQGLFFSGFQHRTCTHTEGLFFFRVFQALHHADAPIFFGIFFCIFLRHLPGHGCCFFQVFLADLKSDALENSAFSLAISLHSRVTSLDLGIGPNYYLSANTSHVNPA